eukprot:363740-Chlamydomonas_euryale.AAC.18
MRSGIEPILMRGSNRCHQGSTRAPPNTLWVVRMLQLWLGSLLLVLLLLLLLVLVLVLLMLPLLLRAGLLRLPACRCSVHASCPGHVPWAAHEHAVLTLVHEGREAAAARTPLRRLRWLAFRCVVACRWTLVQARHHVAQRDAGFADGRVAVAVGGPLVAAAHGKEACKGRRNRHGMGCDAHAEDAHAGTSRT